MWVPHFPHSSGCQVLLILFPKCFSDFLCFLCSTVAGFSQAITVIAWTATISSQPSCRQVTYLSTCLPYLGFLHGSLLGPGIRPKLTPQHVTLAPASAPAFSPLTSVCYWTCGISRSLGRPLYFLIPMTLFLPSFCF